MTLPVIGFVRSIVELHFWLRLHGCPQCGERDLGSPHQQLGPDADPCRKVPRRRLLRHVSSLRSSEKVRVLQLAGTRGRPVLFDDVVIEQPDLSDKADGSSIRTAQEVLDAWTLR